MKLAGLTGGIASGKSTVARMFSDMGARIIDADALAHRVIGPGHRAYEEIIARFGRAVLNDRGQIDRETLGRIVFSDEKARKELERMTHPRIGEEILKEIRISEEKGDSHVLVEAPLLVEAGMHSWLKPFIVVSVPPEVQIDRLMMRNGLTQEEAVRRVRSQMPLEEKAGLADFVIDNSGSLERTRRQVEAVWGRVWGEVEH